MHFSSHGGQSIEQFALHEWPQTRGFEHIFLQLKRSPNVKSERTLIHTNLFTWYVDGQICIDRTSRDTNVHTSIQHRMALHMHLIISNCFWRHNNWLWLYDRMVILLAPFHHMLSPRTFRCSEPYICGHIWKKWKFFTIKTTKMKRRKRNYTCDTYHMENDTGPLMDQMSI